MSSGGETVIDSITDSDGDKVDVSVIDGKVYLATWPGGGCVALDDKLQERFARAWIAAHFQAKANREQQQLAELAAQAVAGRG